MILEKEMDTMHQNLTNIPYKRFPFGQAGDPWCEKKTFILGCGDVQRGGKERMEIDMLNQVLKNCTGASQVALVVKNHLPMQET